MSKDELPDIPSWEELGLTPEEVAELERELAEEGESGAPDAGSQPSAPGTAAAGAAASGQRVSSGGAAGSGKDAKAKKQPKPKRRLFGGGRKKAAKPGKAAGPTGSGASGAGVGGAEGTGAPPSGGGPAKPPPPPLYQTVVTALLLIVGIWFASAYRTMPRPVPATAPDSVCSSERAYAHLERISRAAHPPGSPEHAAVRSYLMEQLSALGFEPQVQTTTVVRHFRGFSRSVTVRNIVARRAGTASTGALLLTAHYDGRGVAFAAGDDGVGVVAILESLRALQSELPLRNDVIVLLTDGEELGLMGARAFVDEHPWFADVRFALSFEMRGAGGPTTMFETGIDGGWAVREFAGIAPAVVANSMAFEVYQRMPNDTDFSPLKEAGAQGLNFAAIGRAHIYHQQYDNVENLDPRTVQQHGINALAASRHFGNADLTDVDAAERVYFTLPVLGFVTYPAWGAWALSGLLLLLFVGLVVRVRRAGVSVVQMVLGALSGLVALALAWGAGWGLLRLVRPFHPEAGLLHGSLFHVEWPYLLAVAAAGLTGTLVVLGTLRRWVSPGALALGGAFWITLLGIAAGVLVPLGAMNLQWPALAALLGAAVVGGNGRDAKSGVLTWVLALVLAVPVVAFLVPLTELLWLALNIGMAPLLGVLVTLGWLALAPLASVLRGPRGWTGIAVAAALALVFTGVGWMASRPSESRPLPSTLLYALDRGTGEALWATDAAAGATADGGVPEGRDSAALEWATAQTGPVDTVRNLAAFTGRSTSYAVSSARVLPTAPPAVRMDRDTVSGAVRLHVLSQLGAEQLRLEFGEGGPTPAALNGASLAGAEDLRVIEHWGAPEGALSVDLGRVSEPFRMVLVEHLLRPEEVVGPGVFDRPADLAPNLFTLSDRVLVRSVLAVDPSAGEVRLEGPGATAPGTVPAAMSPESATGPDAGSADLTGPAPPAIDVAVDLFGRDRISSVAPEFAISFAPDGRTVWFNRTSPDRSEIQMLVSILTNGQWSEPEVVPFADPDALEVDPFVTPDGNRIYFSSNRGETDPDGPLSTWYVDRTPTGWSAPVDPGAPLNSDTDDVFVSAARDGTLVFRSARDGGRNIYAARPDGDGWTEPVQLRFGTTTEASNPLIDPDGRFIVLAMPGPVGSQDLWVSCRTGPDSWGTPVALPAPINSPFADFAPAFHPVDGALLLTSERPGILGPVPDSVRPAGDIWRVDPGYRIEVCD